MEERRMSVGTPAAATSGDRFEASTFTEGRVTSGATAWDDGVVRGARRDRVRWGPIVAGVVTTVVSLVVLTVLGLAIGLSAFEPDDAGAIDASTAASLWGVASALIAFVIGGFVAARTAGVAGVPIGAFHGLMVAAAALAITIWLVTSGVGNLLGSAGGNLADIEQVQANVPDVDVGQAYDTAEDGAWWTLATMGAALAAATLGGVLGHRKADEVDEEHGGRRAYSVR